MIKKQTRVLTLLLAGAALSLLNCKSDPKTTDTAAESEVEEAPPVVEVVTRSMEFIAPDTIPSGWNTFVYKNLSTEPHFILLDKYPEGKSFEDTRAEVIPPFDSGMEHIMEGDGDAAMEAFGEIPSWYSEVVLSGGTGLISPGETAVSTLSLDPGYYVMECYVRMPDGSFHVSMGMAKELIVSSETSDLDEPKSTISLSISSEEGIEMPENIPSGETIFSVLYEDQVKHEHFMEHDVNLVQVADGADLEALEAWINWATPDGLMSSTQPEGFTFLGGTNDAPAGSVHYFEANLTPGRYILIAEVPNASEKGMLREFTVSR